MSGPVGQLRLRSVLAVGVSVALIWVIWSVFRVNSAALGARLAASQPVLVLGAAVIYLGATFLLALRYSALCKIVGIREPVHRFVCYTLIGLFVNNFVPTGVGGDVVKASFLAGSDDRLKRATIITVVDRIVGILCALAVGSAVEVIRPIPGLDSIWFVSWLPRLTLMVLLISAAILVLVTQPAFQPIYRRVAPALRVNSDTSSVFASRLFTSRVLLFDVPLFSLGSLACWALSAWVVARSMGIDVSYPVLVVLTPIVSLATMLPSVNGIGVREALFVIALGQSTTPENALAVAVLFFAVTAVSSMVGGPLLVFHRRLGLVISPGLVRRLRTSVGIRQEACPNRSRT